jgi:hypothetical protein
MRGLSGKRGSQQWQRISCQSNLLSAPFAILKNVDVSTSANFNVRICQFQRFQKWDTIKNILYEISSGKFFKNDEIFFFVFGEV